MSLKERLISILVGTIMFNIVGFFFFKMVGLNYFEQPMMGWVFLELGVLLLSMLCTSWTERLTEVDMDDTSDDEYIL